MAWVPARGNLASWSHQAGGKDLGVWVGEKRQIWGKCLLEPRFLAFFHVLGDVGD